MVISENVVMLDSVKGSHVFLVKGAETVLIDTGMPGRAGQIAGELDRLGVDIKSVGKILLTHHDVDHIGSAKALQRHIRRGGLGAGGGCAVHQGRKKARRRQGHRVGALKSAGAVHHRDI